MKNLLLLVLLSSLAQAAELTPERFGDFYSQLRNSSKIADTAKTLISQRHYVFIAGFLNETLPGYFSDNVEGLKELGVPESNIHIIYPCSAASLSDNVRVLNEELVEIATNAKSPLILVAHSKGALVALRHAIENPVFVTAHVHSLFLLQGALGGSYVADFLRGQGKALDSKLPIAASITLKIMKEAEQFVDPIIESSLTSLTTKAATDELKDLYQRHPKALPVVDKKLYYITGEETPDKTAKVLQATSYYLHMYYGANDGLVLAAHQSIPNFGTVLAHFTHADHADLTSPFPISNEYNMRRRALAKAIALSASLK